MTMTSIPASADASTDKTASPRPSVSTIWPEPPQFTYEDGSGNLHYIFVAPGRYTEVCELWLAEDWTALSKFPPWTGPRGTRQPDSMTYKDEKGIERSVFLPLGSLERATELFVKDDWKALESEFEPYSK